MVKLYLLGVFLYLLVTVNAKFCETKANCNTDETCTNGMCVCAPGKISSNDGFKCLDIAVGIGSECTEDIQCLSWIVGPSVCTIDGFCGCKPGFRYLNNMCTEISGYKGYCSTDLDCYDGINLNALKCENTTCICNDDYYLRGNFDCRLSAKVTKKCFFTLDCESLSECCEFKYGPLGDCVSNLNPNNVCSGIDKESKREFYEAFEETHRLKKNSPLSKIDKTCKKNEDCTSILNSFCPEFNKKCTCKEGLVYNKYSNTCVPMLGSTCIDNKNCPIVNSYCNKDNMCTCQQYFVNSKYNDKCFKPARGIDMSCGRDENCYSLGIYGSCNKNKCDCSFNSKYDEELMLCVPVSNVENKCDDNCVKKPHSSCVANECECDEHYNEINNKCLPDLGYECSVEENDCKINNAECVNNKCDCREGYLKDGSLSCVQIINEGDLCTTNKQCENILNIGGICINGSCTCSQGYEKLFIVEKNMCVLKKKYGDLCTVSTQCKTLLHSEHVVCRNSKCLCDYGYYMKEDKNGKRCTNKSSVLVTPNILFYIIVGILIGFKK